MKRVAILLFFALPTFGQSLSHPATLPVYCHGNVTTCTYPLVSPGNTAVIVATQTSAATLTSWYGLTWTRDFCISFDGDCVFHAPLNVPYPTSLQVTFPQNPNNFYRIMMFTYKGTWDFVLGRQGNYAAGSGGGNTPFPDCAGGDCPYNWTLPVAADPGDLLIGFSNYNATGPGLASPGMGYTVEASDGFLAVEDMIVPKRGPYIGSLTWLAPDGSENGGSHWLMGLAQFRKQ